MKRKKELIILAAIILVLVLYLIFRSQDKVQYQVPEIPEIAKNDISKIEISKQESALVITGKDNKWRVSPQEYLLDKSKIDDMLEIIDNLILDSLVSESKSYFQYDLDDEKRITIKAWNGDNLVREFNIGKIGPSYQHTFVKLKDDPRVFLARQAFRRRFDQSVDDLRDKTVLAFEKTEIQGININTGGKTIALVKNEVLLEKADKPEKEPPETETVWQTAAGEEKEKAKIDQILADYVKLECDSYIDKQTQEDFKDPIYTIQLKGTKDYTLSIFEKMESDANEYPAISSENDYPFMLPEWKVKDIQKKANELVRKITGPEDR